MQLKPGTELQNGKYRIIKTLGQGGFGITYLAEQTGLHRKVAIKEFFMKEYCERDDATSQVSLGTSRGSKDLVARFRGKFVREAQMIAELEHPNIVKIHDVFEENGTAYYVMQFLAGESLSERVKSRGVLPEGEALGYIRQIGKALEYVHARKFLHFDVKPSNILVNESGDAVLIDFGVSKHYDESGSQTSSTPVGISKGYAPLEQYQQNEISTFTPATDIYALGATLYTLLTGSVPPSASEVNEDGLPALPERISKPVRDAIEKAMQPRRKDRPQTVAAFLSLLSASSVPSSSPAASESATEETEIVSKPTPRSTPKPQPQVMPSPAPSPRQSSSPAPALSPASVKKPSKTWLWALLGGLSVAAVIAAIFLGGRKSVPSVTVPSVTVSAATGSINGHEWVDLGLPSGLKWATCNVGASSPSDYGNYYAWGETAPKSDYSWSNLKYCTGLSGDHFSRYVPSDEVKYWSGSGNPDNKMELELLDDAAHANWGGSWRMPTDAEWMELLDRCSWTWTTQGGKNGYKVTSGTNGNSIFLPAAGYRNESSLNDAGSNGYYWSSSLDSDNPNDAWLVFFFSGEVYGTYYVRFRGQSVRPVSE